MRQLLAWMQVRCCVGWDGRAGCWSGDRRAALAAAAGAGAGAVLVLLPRQAPSKPGAAPPRLTLPAVPLPCTQNPVPKDQLTPKALGCGNPGGAPGSLAGSGGGSGGN